MDAHIFAYIVQQYAAAMCDAHVFDYNVWRVNAS